MRSLLKRQSHFQTNDTNSHNMEVNLFEVFAMGVDYGQLLMEQERDQEDLCDAFQGAIIDAKYSMPSQIAPRRMPHSDKWREAKAASLHRFVELIVKVKTSNEKNHSDMKTTKPILFSTPMVKAILDGRKTQTRRVIKDEQAIACIEVGINGAPILAPFNVGGVLWVRETWCFEQYGTEKEYFYRADEPNATDYWKPSIFMPKEAARIFLEVTSVRAERLQEMPTSDANKEGIYSFWNKDGISVNGIPNVIEPPRNQTWSRKEAFQKLWEKINGAQSWNENPFVWVYTFKQVSKPENF